MKSALAAIGLALAVAVTASAQSKPNFSGTWILDVAKSDFGGAPALTSMSHEIQHKGTTIGIATTQKTAQLELVNRRTLTTDGKENTNHLKTSAGDQDVKSTSKWDGPRLLTTMTLDVQGTPASVTDTWELSADARVLTITRSATMPDGSITQKFVFNKQ